MTLLIEYNLLSKFKIQIDVGREHNKQKNPVAENAIKELRKEWLRFDPEGEKLSETDLAMITCTINNRIRLNGLAPREILLKRSLHNNKPILVDDRDESRLQNERRKTNNERIRQSDLLTRKSSTTQVKIGNIVF